ncbi:MAG TPA: radical SAM protein, partial [Micromonosporaceae bacterium]|nr:radical SAM protein [Micromonosporaceae bacterium]
MSATGPPQPFRQVLLKIHSRCNLACDHCYVYRSADQSWRNRPVIMARQTIDRTAARMAEHARAHHLSWMQVVLHGGEPLLAGPELISYAVRAIRSAAPTHTEIRFSVQTNGLLLDTEFLDLFVRHGINVGVSLDGGQAANDLHRVFADGRGSYHHVALALRLLSQEPYRSCYSGLLCTVDTRNDPVRVYTDLLAFSP